MHQCRTRCKSCTKKLKLINEYLWSIEEENRILITRYLAFRTLSNLFKSWSHLPWALEQNQEVPIENMYLLLQNNAIIQNPSLEDSLFHNHKRQLSAVIVTSYLYYCFQLCKISTMYKPKIVLLRKHSKYCSSFAERIQNFRADEIILNHIRLRSGIIL